MRIVTNNEHFAKYANSKFIEVYYRTKPETVFRDDLYIIWPETHAINMSGNKYLKQHRDTGEMYQNYRNMLDWFKCGEHVMLITSVCSFGGGTMKAYEPDLYDIYSLMNIDKYCIDTWQLGEIVNLRKIQVWTNDKNIPQLVPVVHTKPQTNDIKYGYNNHQDVLNFNVFKQYRDKNLRRKLRKTVEFSLYSEIVKQVVNKYGRI